MGTEARQGASHRWLGSGLAAGLLWLALALFPSAAGAILPDASCPGPPDAAALPVLGDRREAQTFTAVHTGALQRATVDIDNLDATAPDFLVQIIALDSSGTPTNTALASATISKNSVPAGAATLDARFSPGANVVAGQSYALAISRPVGGGLVLLPTWDLHTRNAAACPGSTFYSSGPAAGWTAETTPVDFIFQTFVNPANKFTIVGKKGRLFARVPGPGDVRVKGTKLVHKAHATARAAGDVQLKIKLTSRAIRHILATRRLNLPLFVTFTPSGGDPNTQKFKIKIRI